MQGSCLCGAVAYEAEPPASGLRIGLCSCRTCRKAHASPFAVTAPVPRETFRWLRGEGKLRIYESSPGKNRYFCMICSSHLIAEHPGEPNVLLRVALLDDDPGARPVDHIFRSHEVSWCAWEGRDIKHYAEWPPGRG
jgi:ADP-ribosyl-[dinitrogen reductase] hydrolase